MTEHFSSYNVVSFMVGTSCVPSALLMVRFLLQQIGKCSIEDII
jgi:hypothetical protein